MNGWSRAAGAAVYCFPIPAGIAAPPAHAAYLYLNSYGWDKTYRYDPASGANQLVPAADILKAGFISAADTAADGIIYGGSSADLYRVQIGGAVAYWDKVQTLADGFDALAFGPGNQLYTAQGSTLRKVGAGGQTLSSVSVLKPGNVPVAVEGIDFSSGGTLYAIDSGAIYSVDPLTGAATTLVTRPNLAGGIFSEIDVADDGIVRVLGSFDYLFTYNPGTGASGWQPGPLQFNGQSFSPSALASAGVPEPGTLGLLAVAGLVMWARRRRTPRHPSGRP